MVPRMVESEAEDEVDFGYRRVRREEKARLVRDVFDRVAHRYDLMNDLMSGGIHRLWKAELIDRLTPRPGETILDVAGGTGDVALAVLERLRAKETAPGCIVVCDVNQAMLETGRDRAIDRGVIAGIEWLCGDAERLPVASASVDAYTI